MSAFKPALGTSASPAFGEQTAGETVDLHIGRWKDGRWSYLYGDDTSYQSAMPDLEAIERAARAARTGPLPEQVQGPIINPPVWTWEIPLYWTGGIAAGSSFVAWRATWPATSARVGAVPRPGAHVRYAWVGAGRQSARHDRVVAQMARQRGES